MNVISGTVIATIDGGPEWPCSLETEARVEYALSWSAMKPDPKWEYIDDAGHFHAFAKDAELPTLNGESVPVPCNGSCGGSCDGEGYTVRRWTCRICGQEVEPGYVPDYEARTTGTPIPLGTEVTVKVSSREPVAESRDEVSLRVRTGDDELFGTGYVIGTAVEGGGPDGMRWLTTISARSLDPRLT